MRRDATKALSKLAAVHLTYQEVGATRAASLPEGYGHVHRDVSLGSGPEVFERAVAALFGWRMHQEAGLAVSSGGNPAPGVVVILRAGWGPLHLTIPCRVVYTVAEADRRGFAYGTLPGHPERGEEAFLVARNGSGDVRVEIRAFSRIYPGHWDDASFDDYVLPNCTALREFYLSAAAESQAVLLALT